MKKKKNPPPHNTLIIIFSKHEKQKRRETKLKSESKKKSTLTAHVVRRSMSVSPAIGHLAKCLPLLSSHSSSVDEESNALEIVDFSFFFFILFQSIFFVVVVGSIFFPKQLYIFIYIFIHVLFGWFERWIHGALRCNHWTCVHFLFMSTQVQSSPSSPSLFFF